MGVFAGPEITSDGLVLSLDAGNTKSYPGSGTTWTDLSGRGNTGTLTNGPTYSSSNGGSIVFDGSNDYVLTSSSSDFIFGTGNYTVSYWFYLNTFANLPTIFDLRETTDVVSNAFADYIQSNKFNLYLNGTTVYYGVTTLQTQKWYNIVLTRSGSNGSVFINGSLDGTFTNSTNLSQGQLRLGTNVNLTNFLNGRISNVLIYKGKALTSAEIQQNFNAVRGRFGI